jgi:hypothetical protein
MLTGISLIGFGLGVIGVMLGIPLAVLRGIFALMSEEEYPLWNNIIKWFLLGGGLLTIISFSTCLVTLKH